MTTPLTRQQKRAVAGLLIAEAGSLLEFWSDKVDQRGDDDLRGVTAQQAARVLATWLKDLPGDSWHHLLDAV